MIGRLWCLLGRHAWVPGWLPLERLELLGEVCRRSSCEARRRRSRSAKRVRKARKVVC